jgi:hypothetical protein
MIRQPLAGLTGRLPTPKALEAVEHLVPGPFQLQREETALGFVDMGAYSTAPRVFAMSQAQEKQGKTHLASTLPGDVIVGLSNDPCTKDVMVAECRKRGKRYIHNSFLSKGELKTATNRQQKAKDELKRLGDVLGYVLGRTDWRSLLIDTGGGVYDLVRLARFGKLIQIPPHFYVDANEDMKGLVDPLKTRPDLNVLITHRMKKLYKKNEWDGKAWEAEAWGGMKYAADIIIEHNRTKDAAGVPVFNFTVLDSNVNAAGTIGQTFSSRVPEIVAGPDGVDVYSGQYFDECSIPMLASVMWPDAPAGMWE